MIALFLAAAIINSAAPGPERTGFAANNSVRVRAQVLVLILEGATVHFNRGHPSAKNIFHRASVHIDGQIQPAQLVEFP